MSRQTNLVEKLELEKAAAQRDEALERMKYALRAVFDSNFDPNLQRAYHQWAIRAAHPGMAWPDEAETRSILREFYRPLKEKE